MSSYAVGDYIYILALSLHIEDGTIGVKFIHNFPLVPDFVSGTKGRRLLVMHNTVILI